MPLSLLLTDTLSVLTGGVRRIERWESLTATWTLVVTRLRSAWAVGWFGTRLPVQGIDLLVAFVNHDALRRRWALVTRGGPGGRPDGPSLLEPLLGIGGALYGTIATPLNGLLALAALARLKQGIGLTVTAVVNAVLYGLPASVVLVLAAPLAAVLVLANVLSGQHTEELELLAALTALVVPLRVLWRQASGRDPVRNPLLAQLLVLLDRVVALLPHLLSVVAVAVTRIAPLLVPMRDAIGSTYLAVTEIMTMLRLVAEDTWTALSSLWSGPRYLTGVLGVVTRAVTRLLARVGALVRGTQRELTEILERNLAWTLVRVGGWLVAVAAFVKRVLVDHPVVRALLGLAQVIGVVKGWAARRPATPPSTSPPSPPSPWLTSFPWPVSVRVLRTVLRHSPPVPSLTVPDFPSLIGPGSVPPIAEAMRRGGFGAPADPLALDARQRSALERYRRPPAALGGLAREVEGAARTDERGRDRVFSLAEAIGRLTELVGPAVEGSVGAQAASVLPRLDALLDQLDVAARGDRTVDYPTRDLPEPSEVRPVIGTLRLRTVLPDGSAGTDTRVRADLETFTTALRRRLDAEPYRVPAAAGRAAP